MKKILLVFVPLLICVSVLLCNSCGGALFVTDDYRRMSDIDSGFDRGEIYSKQDIFNKLGYPEYYTTAEGEGNKLLYEERDLMKDTLFSTDVTVWSYTCYELPDPANPHSLRIVFDSQNESIEVTFELIPGG